jgi:hypothetical protein
MMEKSSQKSQLFLFRKDDPFADLLRYDQEKKRIRFDATLEGFHELTDEQREKLSPMTRYGYDIALEEFNEMKNRDVESEEDEEALMKIIGATKDGSATLRMDIVNKREGFEYKWIRPDMRARYMGAPKFYKIVQNGPEETLANPTGKGPHIMGDKGSEELILVCRPTTLAAAERRVKKEKARELREGVDHAYDDALTGEGIQVLDKAAESRGKFSPIRQDS